MTKIAFLCPLLVHCLGSMKSDIVLNLSLANVLITACFTVSIHCAPEMSEIDCIGLNL